jgi:hypothetical protein
MTVACASFLPRASHCLTSPLSLDATWLRLRRVRKNCDESLSLIHRPPKMRKEATGQPSDPGPSRMFGRLGIYQGPRPLNSSPSS